MRKLVCTVMLGSLLTTQSQSAILLEIYESGVNEVTFEYSGSLNATELTGHLARFGGGTNGYTSSTPFGPFPATGLLYYRDAASTTLDSIAMDTDHLGFTGTSFIDFTTLDVKEASVSTGAKGFGFRMGADPTLYLPSQNGESSGGTIDSDYTDVSGTITFNASLSDFGYTVGDGVKYTNGNNSMDIFEAKIVASPVPEPSALLFMSTGIGLMTLRRRRNNREDF